MEKCMRSGVKGAKVLKCRQVERKAWYVMVVVV